MQALTCINGAITVWISAWISGKIATKHFEWTNPKRRYVGYILKAGRK
jgi:phage-related protein